MAQNNLTHGAVQLKLQKGSTTQNDVIEAFGAPNITTIDGDGKEVWTYRRHATVTSGSGQTLTSTSWCLVHQVNLAEGHHLLSR